jgi:multisubunit Na+/H+ antiporter MnhG subunit
MVSLISLEDSKYKPSFTTPWTIIHTISGITFANLSKHLDFKSSFIVFFIIHTIYELKDIYSKGSKNSAFNSIGDQTFGVLGFLIGWKIGMKHSAILVLALFIWLLNPKFSKNGKWSNGFDIWESRG